MSTPRKVIYISDHFASETARLLDSFARSRPSEGVVYWFGVENADCAVVTSLIVPNADTTNGCIYTTAEDNAMAVAATVDTPLVYLGQAHSHPGSSVAHSPTDDKETFARFEGAISVVVPWFGRYGFNLAECGIYRHVGGSFHAVTEVNSHLRVIPGLLDLRARSVRE
jgi:hypothetical protein